MKPPHMAGTGRGQAGGLAQSLPESTASGAACIFVCVKAPQKPLKPVFYSGAEAKTPAQTGKTVENGAGGLSRIVSPPTAPITSRPTPTHTGTAQGEREKPAPSAQKLFTLPPLGEGSPGGFRGEVFSTPTPQVLAFTPSPRVLYRELCEQHASLSEYIEREAPEMRARGEYDALGELEKIAGRLLDRLSELQASGAHLGSAGGAR